MRELHFSVAYNRLLSKARLRHLQLIVALSDLGSIKGAAQVLGISQPAATQLLSDLETLLEMQLFFRHSRGVRPTPSCEPLIPVLRLFLRSIETSLQSMSFHGSKNRRSIRIGCIPAAAAVTVSEGVAHDLLANSDLEVSIHEASMEQLLPDLIAGRLDAVCGRPPAKEISCLRFVPVTSDFPQVLVCSTHPLAGRHVESHLELARFPRVLFSLDSEAEAYVDGLLSASRHSNRGTRISTNSLSVMLLALHQADRIAIIPSSLSSIIERHTALKFINIELPSVKSVHPCSLGWIFRTGEPRSALDELISLIHTEQ